MKSFKDELDTAVITTTHVTRHRSSILFVYHFDDGYWQFSGIEKNLSDKDFIILALEEIITLDASVLEVADLPYGSMASRKSLHDSWVISHKIN